MSHSFVLTAIGDDRPGLVGELAAVVDAHEGSWLESRMTRLAGKFAGIVHVACPSRRAEDLGRALAAMAEDGLIVTATSASPSTQAEPRLHVLTLMGPDHPGIVHEVAGALAHRKVNVEDLVTTLEPAPMSGEPLFRATATLLLPAEVDDDGLRDDLERLAHGLVVEINLVEVGGS